MFNEGVAMTLTPKEFIKEVLQIIEGKEDLYASFNNEFIPSRKCISVDDDGYLSDTSEHYRREALYVDFDGDQLFGEAVEKTGHSPEDYENEIPHVVKEVDEAQKRLLQEYVTEYFYDAGYDDYLEILEYKEIKK